MSTTNFQLSKESLDFIESRGYNLSVSADQIEIKNRKKVAFAILLLSGLAGLAVIIAGALTEPQVMIVGALLLLYPILSYRKNANRITKLDCNEKSLAGFDFGKLARILTQSTEEFRAVDPFNEGNKNYIDLITIETLENNKIELFYFVDPESRKQELIEEIVQAFAQILKINKA